MKRDYKEALDTRKPMASARIVRRDKFAWPGGYALALVTHDGDILCPACVHENFHEISTDNRTAHGTGWKAAGILCEADTDEGEICSHCGREIWGAKE